MRILCEECFCEGTCIISQIPPPCFISQLMTVQTDYSDYCPYIVQYTPNTKLTLSFIGISKETLARATQTQITDTTRYGLSQSPRSTSLITAPP